MFRKSFMLLVALFVVGCIWAVDVDTIERAEASSPEVIGSGDIVRSVNFRTAPTLSSDVNGMVPRGTTVQVLDEVNSHWLEIEYDGTVGYVSSQSRYIDYALYDEDVVGKGTIRSRVNFRDAPSLDSSTYGTLSAGTAVTILEEVNQYWLKVHAEGRTGYISARSQYVSYEGNGGGSSSSEERRTVSTSTAKAEAIIETGLQYEGTKYVFGARSGQTNTFDCSSFTQYVYGEHGINLPRNSRQQSTTGERVSRSNIQAGDLLFFNTGSRSDGRIDHVAIYMGDGDILHTIPNGGVQVGSMTSYWENNYVSARRVIN